ncbi:MAG: hypothetical protein K2H41_07695 [Acetatifactor sp.]|nr:hypothetical protein [Acetatifactor sp.]
MPLYPQDGQAFVDDGLRTLIYGTVLDDLKSRSDSVQALMVGGVDLCGPAVEKIEQRARLDESGVVDIFAGFQMKACARHILHNRSAKSGVDQLHAFADAKNWESVFDAELQCLKLQDVQFCVHSPGAFVFFAEKGGSDVAAAGQQEPMAGGNLFGIEGGDGLESVFF